jgi:hypothetical protein
MKNENLTNEECDLLDEKADALGEILSDTPAHIVLHALMRLVADVGVQARDEMTKREFVADCVECLDFWYETWVKEDADE